MHTGPVDTSPVTGGQTAIWLADQALAPTAAYHTYIAFTFRTGAGRAAIEAAFAQLVDGTPALRLRMGLDRRGALVQWFSDAPPPPLRWVGSPVEALAGPEIDPALREQVLAPFQTDGGQLCRMVAGASRSRDTVAVLVLHHLINDGASQVALARRFVDCLTGPVEPEPPRRYLALVDAVRRAEQRAAADHEYWVDRLIGRMSDRAWPLADGTAGYLRHRLPSAAVARAAGLAERTGGTPFLVLVAAVHRALGSLGLGSSTVAVAASVRPQDGRYDDVVGCFTNQVPLVAVHRDGEPFASLVAREVPGWRVDLSRRALPIVALAAEPRLAGTARELSRVMVSLRRAPVPVIARPGLLRVTVDLFKRYYQPKADLAVRYLADRGGLACDVEWGPALPPGLRGRLPEALSDPLAEAG